MRKKRAITMLVSAAVILLLCGPICLHAQETAERTDTDGNEISGGSAIIGDNTGRTGCRGDAAECIVRI